MAKNLEPSTLWNKWMFPALVACMDWWDLVRHASDAVFQLQTERILRSGSQAADDSFLESRSVNHDHHLLLSDRKSYFPAR